MLSLPKPTKLQMAELPLFLDEDNYAYEMAHIVEPSLAEVIRSGCFSYRGTKGRKIYYELFPQTSNIGTIVISHGYTETCLKYHEMIYYLYQMGYQVAIMDHRGHGRSFRMQEDTSIIHVDHFSDYVKDLHVFVQRVVIPKLNPDPEKFYLFGHSMGGGIAARYLEVYPKDFSKAILNSPMIGLITGGTPEFAVRLLGFAMKLCGKSKERCFNQAPLDPVPNFPDCCADSEARYLYYHQKRVESPLYASNGGSYSWILSASLGSGKLRQPKEIAKIKTPVLMICAGNDTLVSRDAQEAFLTQLPGSVAYEIPGVKHEIYRAPNDVLIDYYCTIRDFFC